MAILLIFFLFGFSVIAFTYLSSYIFKNIGNAQLNTYLIHLLIGAILPFVFFILYIIESTRDTAKILVWFCRLIPSFALGNGILNIGNSELYSRIMRNDDSKISPWDLEFAGGDILMLGVTGIMYYLFLFLVEFLLNNTLFNKLVSRE